ncbi:hypothetical protein LCGC14_0044040 [marine sediment metagenome]|uniref:GIY-YIG nuclease family protein n=2 Tax=root TaxID=1 RepID=A0A7V1BHS3_9RHOB|nr:GIY-YIG nuclease family protein [Sulfitobacter litoralis]HDZ53457.1 GIY-YIG nuclease family protein [Sulfitobacter litoralis]
MSQQKGSIYAYTTPAYRDTRWTGRRRGRGLIKVGYTRRDPHVRIREQIGASSPEKDPYTLLLTAQAVKRNGKTFSDKDVHRILRGMGVRNVHNEWFEARPEDIRSALKMIDARSVRKGRRHSRRKRKPAPFRRIKTAIYASLTGTVFYAALFPEQARAAGSAVLSLAIDYIASGV